MEETAENTTSSTKTEIQAYVVMQYLVKHKVSTFKELANLLGLEQVGNHLPNNYFSVQQVCSTYRYPKYKHPALRLVYKHKKINV